jgi:hypothetical protein
LQDGFLDLIASHPVWCSYLCGSAGDYCIRRIPLELERRRLSKLEQSITSMAELMWKR